MRLSKRERRKPQRLEDENANPSETTPSPKTIDNAALPLKRNRKKPKRFDEEVQPSLPKKSKPQTIVTGNMRTKAKSNAEAVIKAPVKNEIKTYEASGKMNVRKTRQGNSYVVKSKINTVIDVSDAEIDVQTASAAQIQKAAKKKYRPTKSDMKKLIQVPSHSNRATIYLNAAKAISKKESRALPSHGARPWFCHVSITDEQGTSASSSNYNDDIVEVKKGAKGKNSMRSSPLFVWNKYHLELAVLPHLLHSIDEIDTNHGLLKSVQEEVNAIEMEEGYITDDDDYINQLIDRPITVISTVANNDSSYVTPSIDRKWISPDLVTFRSRNAAIQHSLMLLDRDKLIDRVLHGIGSRGAFLKPKKPTRKLALEAGYLRFLRDGLWVVGQEEGWIEERIEHINMKGVNDDNSTKIDGITSVGGSEQANENVAPDDGRSGESADQQNESSSSDTAEGSPKDKGRLQSDGNEASDKCVASHLENNKDTNDKKNETDVIGTEAPVAAFESSRKGSEQKVDSDVKKKILKQKNEKTRKIDDYVTSSHWRLTSEQIDMCSEAILDHYEKVMYTVKAKALYAELADGFDVFRERGRGRFDMTIEKFDKPEFGFLTDINKTPLIPIVRKILGEDATLVHKGAFLSMPGAETQVYHQDGVHLNKKYQKPCHAINVFIPLIDLKEKNGPTEFCIGTHYLGYEDYNKELIDTPLVQAGCPVIFDYRLGHRGLGNNSREPRPIVYLTFTRSSKEFRDAVNFSSKRYIKLGDMIEKPISRNERALKRTRDS